MALHSHREASISLTEEEKLAARAKRFGASTAEKALSTVALRCGASNNKTIQNSEIGVEVVIKCQNWAGDNRMIM